MLLRWVNSDIKEWNLLGVYDSQYTCTTDYSIFDRRYRSSNYFSFIFVYYNLIVSSLILIFYVMAFINVHKRDRCCLTNLNWKCCNLPCCSCRCLWSNNIHFQPNNAERSAENRRIFKRIAIIVFTDLMCWIPLCMTTLVLYVSTNQHQEEFNTTDDVPFTLAALLLIPINSLFNPYIYSFHLWVRLFKKLKIKICNK